MSMRAKNTVLKIGDAQMSEGFTQITKITDQKWSGVAWDTEDTTNHDNSTPVKTAEPTLYSNGTIQLVITYDPNNTNHALLRTLSTTGAARNFQVLNVNSAESKQFSGFVTNFTFDTPVGGLLKANVTVMVNGAFSDIS